MNALFVTHEHSISAGGGGQQVCSREYVEVLRRAGFELSFVTYTTDRRFPTRLRRKFLPRAYQNQIPPDLAARVAVEARRTGARFVFLNLNSLIPVAEIVKQAMPPGAALVLLSHGLSSVDEVHAVRISESLSHHKGGRSWNCVAQMLDEEVRGLPFFDHVFCLAGFEVEICRWLGARSVSALPRTVLAAPLDWQPSGRMLGCVGTMDHPPNEEGLWLFLDEIKKILPEGVRIRLVSRSREVCRRAARLYSFVDFLGPLESDAALRMEAATWNAFLHPIFCHAMGCSTKVAIGCSWALPIITSTAGLRGYDWALGTIRTHDTAGALAKYAVECLDKNLAESARAQVIAAVRQAPSLEEVGRRAASDLRVGETIR